MDYKSLLFNIDIPSGTAPAPGSLLISEPFLHEAHFDHAVIALVEFEPGGTAMGVVLNNPSEYSLQELIEGVEIEKPIPVFSGGPVGNDRLFFIHTLGEEAIPGTQPLGNGLWIGGDFGPMLDIVNSGYDLEGHVRFFLGYSGWTESQLEGEIASNVWAVAPMTAEPSAMITGEGDAFWHREVRALGSEYRGWLYHPQNPMAN